MSKVDFTPAHVYNQLPDVDSGRELDSDDVACMTELRDVLAKHGKLDRFGVSLLHRHFDLREGEVLLEECDPTARTMTIKAVPGRSIAEPEKSIATNWHLREGGAVMVCNQVCHPSRGGHSTSHS